MAKPDGIKILADNRRVRRNYHYLETFEAGIALTGPEVKSARAGQIQLLDAYAAVKDNELWLFNAHIQPYSHSRLSDREPDTVRKLLMHRREIDRLIGAQKKRPLKAGAFGFLCFRLLGNRQISQLFSD